MPKHRRASPLEDIHAHPPPHVGGVITRPKVMPPAPPSAPPAPAPQNSFDRVERTKDCLAKSCGSCFDALNFRKARNIYHDNGATDKDSGSGSNAEPSYHVSSGVGITGHARTLPVPTRWKRGRRCRGIRLRSCLRLTLPLSVCDQRGCDRVPEDCCSNDSSSGGHERDPHRPANR